MQALHLGELSLGFLSLEHASLPVHDDTSVLEVYTEKNSLFAKGMCLCKTYSSARCCTERKILASASSQSSSQLPRQSLPFQHQLLGLLQLQLEDFSYGKGKYKAAEKAR